MSSASVEPGLLSPAQLAIGSAESSADVVLTERPLPEAGPSESHEIASESEESDFGE